jgi:hypothetical protein
MGQGDEIRVAVVYTQWWLFISLNYPLWMLGIVYRHVSGIKDS